MKKNQGFTLIELLVVIAIIGILASVILSIIEKQREKYKVQKSVTQKSNLEDKFSRASIDEESNYDESNPCGNIDNVEARKQCEQGTYNSKMIQQCVERYSN